MHTTTPSEFFILLVEIGFHHVGQTGLELMTSSGLSSLGFQSAGITGVSSHAWPRIKFGYRNVVKLKHKPSQHIILIVEFEYFSEILFKLYKIIIPYKR